MECFVEQVQIVGRTNEFGKTGGGRNGVFCLEWNLCLLYTSAFGSDKYYTIGSLGTINGCCSGILQNRKRFDFVGFNITHASGYTVHKYQWRCTTRKGTYASNPKLCVIISGFTRTLYCNQTGDLSGKTVIQASRRDNDILWFDGTHRNDYAFLFLLSVADYYNFVQRFGVFVQHHIDVAAPFYFYFFGYVSKIWYLQNCIVGRNHNLITSFYIGYCSDVWLSFYYNIGSDDRFSFAVCYYTCYFNLILLRCFWTLYAIHRLFRIAGIYEWRKT